MEEKLLMITEQYIEANNKVVNLEYQLMKSREEIETHQFIERCLKRQLENINNELMKVSMKAGGLENESYRASEEIRNLKNEIRRLEQISEKSNKICLEKSKEIPRPIPRKK